MESEFTALDKASEEAEWLHHFLEDFQYGHNLCLLSAFIAIVNQQLEEHKVIYITVSLDIFVGDIIP